MKTEFRKQFLKDVQKIKDKKLLSAIEDAILNVENASKPSEIENLKKLKGSENHFRIKIDKHRLGLYLDNNMVEFVCCLPRKDIYKYFP